MHGNSYRCCCGSGTYKRICGKRLANSDRERFQRLGSEFSLRSKLFLLAAFLVSAAITSFAVPTRSGLISATSPTFANNVAWMQIARFAPAEYAERSCAAFTPPQAISERTPVGLGNDTQAKLNFVITRDGEVGAIVVLHLSAGDEGDLIGAVMGWRFRPATCDGIPIDSEANLELQSRR
jgi:hypothetical protein